jgi:hypothetical protein
VDDVETYLHEHHAPTADLALVQQAVAQRLLDR